MNRKTIIVLVIISLLLLNPYTLGRIIWAIQGLNDAPIAEQAMVDNSVWVSQEPELRFQTMMKQGKSAPEDWCITVDGCTHYVVFHPFTRNRAFWVFEVTVQEDGTPVVYDGLLGGTWKLKNDVLILTINKKDDMLFHGKYDTLTFTKEQ